MRSTLSVALLSLLTIGPLSTASAAEPSTAAAGTAETGPAWKSLLTDVDPATAGVAGVWTKTDAGLAVEAAPCARLQFPEITAGAYDLRVSFTRRTGRDSIAILFPHGRGQAAFEVDAWGLHLAGIQNIGGSEIRNNASRRNDVALTNGRRYAMTLEVRAGQVRGLLDGEVVTTYTGDGADLALSNFWTLAGPRRAGIAAWESDTTFHNVEFREVNASVPSMATPNVASTTPSNSATATSANPPAKMPAATTGRAPVARTTPRSTPRATATTKSGTAKPTNGKKRVLIVIANHHFFYREYADPRAALEAAGVEVTVAAGQKAPCRPHPNSGQRDAGVVQPDLALADVKSGDYDAILFSGGWGASAYQFAFEGRYDDQAYNGDPAVKLVVNRLIGEFMAQDKYIGGICNGVSVLAWARVRNVSPLYGRNICAPPGPAAPGIYNGQRAQPSSRWHPEANGANIAPAGSVGAPGNTTDDVMVDGKIITAEDDYSAREAGRRLAQLLGAD